MTDEQMKKYGIQYSPNETPLNHIKSKKEYGVTIKVMTLEEQKKAEEEKERRKKEEEDRLIAREKETVIPTDNLVDLFAPHLAFYTTGDEVLFINLLDTTLLTKEN